MHILCVIKWLALYLCMLQVIFNAISSKESMQSFSMPFYCMREIELEQPIFGANYIKGKIISEQGGTAQNGGDFYYH